MRTYLIIILSATLFLNAYTQQDTLTIQKDTTLNLEVDLAVSLLKKADSIKIADSISKEVLKKQLDELRTYEKSKRIKLQKKLAELIVNDSLRKVKLKREVDSLKLSAKGYVIKPYKDTLFVVYTKIGSITAAERSEIINERLAELYQSFFLKTDSLTIVDNGKSVDLFFKSKIIVSITELDELWYNKKKIQLASEIKSKIERDIPLYKKERSLFSILKKIALSLLIIIVQIILIKLVNILFKRKVNSVIWKKKGIWFTGVKIKNYEILNEVRQTAMVVFMANSVKIFINLVQLYITIPIVFSVFPPTKRFAETMFGYVLTPLKKMGGSLIDYIPELITIIVIVTITRYLVKFLLFLSKEIEDEKLNIPGFFPDWAKPTFNILRFFVYAFMFVVIFPYLPGSDSNVFKGVSVFIGVLFSLGSSSIIGNMVAGMVITYMRPFKIGDRIKIGEVVGNVFEKTPFATRIRTPKKEFITIPNSNVLSSNVINYSNSKLQGGLIVHTTVTIGYDVPWRLVHQILTNAAKKTSYLNFDIAPFVLQTSLDDFYVSYQLNAHTNEPDKQPAIYSELHQNIQDGFNEEGIEILSPHYRAARDGNTMAIPKDYLPEDYKTSGFKIEKDL
ncbi:MAG: mechanosensitive ion channel family protein [Salinivirgaceae bacterium]|jgi:small-conductance mechanosensitive channel|nr:mechanosensitive ion channel family protein [Salinivirgaceae bacterium]